MGGTIRRRHARYGATTLQLNLGEIADKQPLFDLVSLLVLSTTRCLDELGKRYRLKFR